MQHWQRLNSHIVFDTPYFRIRQDTCRLPDGREIDDYYVMETPDIALVVACSVEQEFILVEQYKHGISTTCLEIPGGYCDSHSDDPLHDAQRELREETGYISDTWHKLAGWISSPTRANNYVHIYLALDAKPTGEQTLDPNESIRIRRLPVADTLTAIRQGQINVPDSVAGLMLALDWMSHNGETSHG